MTVVPDEFVRLAESLADRVREVARLASLEPEVEIKSDGTPVTTLDREVEAELRRVIEREQPGHGIIGEEFGAEGTDRDWVWVLDPVDGTRQFAAGLPNFGTLIALCHEGRPVIGVIAHLFYESVCIGVTGRGTLFNRRPVRCAGSDRLSEIVACISDPDAFDARTTPGMQAIRLRTRWNVFDGGCLGYASLARGLVGLCLNGPNLECFDIAALVPVVEAAGGTHHRLAGQRPHHRVRGRDRRHLQPPAPRERTGGAVERAATDPTRLQPGGVRSARHHR